MSIAKYIINIEEFAKEFTDISLTPDMGLGDLEDLLESKLEEILDILKQILEQTLKRQLTFKSISMSKHIPAIVNDFIIERTFEKDIYLTGITFSQSAWKAEDRVSLEIEGHVVVDGIFTKELGQQKYFSAFLYVPAGIPVRMFYHNNSGNSKMFWCDLDYLNDSPPPYIPPPVEPPIEPPIIPPENPDIEIETPSEKIFIDIWDFSAEDNDTLNIYLNGILIVEQFVSYNTKNRVEIDNLRKGINVLKFEGIRSELSDVSCNMNVYEEDGTTPILNKGNVEFSLSLPSPGGGWLTPPYPFKEWSIYRN